ncbi:MAG: outer membrane protein [Lentimonas sp.]|jgi:outer membrane protein
MFKIKFILIPLSFLSFFSIGQETGLTAKQAIFAALKNNYDVIISEKQEEIAEKNNAWSEAGLFPTVSLQVGQNNFIQDNTNNPFTFTPGVILSQNLSPSLVANINLFSGFQVRINKQRLEQLQVQSEGNSMVLIEGLIQDILKTYFTAVLQKERSELFKNTMQYSKRRLLYSEIKNKYSSSNSLELLQLKNQYLTDSTNFLLQEINYKNSLRNLVLLMNNSEDENAELPELTDNLDLLLNALNKEDALREMSSNNQNLKNQYLALQMQRTVIDLQRSFLYPTLGVSLSASPSFGRFEQLSGGGSQGPTSLVTQTLSYSGNINFRYNLYNNWKGKRAVEVAKMQMEIAELNTEKLKATLNANLLNLFDFYEVRNRLANVSFENLDYATKAYELAQKRFELGTINSIDLIVFQNSYQSTQIQHLENLYNRLDTYLEIYKMTGKIRLEYPGN